MSLLFDEPHIIHQPPLSLRKIAKLNLNNQQIIGTHTLQNIAAKCTYFGA
jgi:hypothetical protein